MDRSLSFFLDTYSPPELETGKTMAASADYPTVQFETTTTTEYYAADGSKVNSDPPEKKVHKARASLYSSNVYVNYRGDNNANTYAKGDPSDETDISLSSIIAWSQGKGRGAMRLKTADLAYLRNIGVYPANRLIVLRRFGGGAPDDLFSNAGMKPLATVVGFISPEDEESAFTVNFNEKWEPSVKEGLVDVINKVIGFSNKSALLPNFEGASNLEQNIAMQVGKALGITKSADNPKGDPNMLHEAAIRATEYDGLRSPFSIQFTTEYEIQYVHGIDPGQVYHDIIGNLVRMGTSPENFIGTNSFGALAKSIQRSLENGKFTELVKEIFSIFTSAVGDLASRVIDGIRKAGTAVAKAVQSKEAASALLNSAEQKGREAVAFFMNEINTLIATNVRRFRWPLTGAIASLTGAHTAPWHITIGNPKAPFISVGNLIMDDVKLEVGNQFLFNDRPTKIKVTYKLSPGRNRGANGITSIFNVGKGRIYVPIQKKITKAVVKK